MSATSTRGGGRGGSRQSARSNGAVTGLISAQSPSNRANAGAATGEESKLRQKYKSQLATAHELFPDWSDDDLIATLTEYNGDVEQTILAISEGEPSSLKWTRNRL